MHSSAFKMNDEKSDSAHQNLDFNCHSFFILLFKLHFTYLLGPTITIHVSYSIWNWIFNRMCTYRMCDEILMDAVIFFSCCFHFLFISRYVNRLFLFFFFFATLLSFNFLTQSHADEMKWCTHCESKSLMWHGVFSFFLFLSCFLLHQ